MLKKHIHIVGICGVATSAIAIAFKDAGFKVTGSDKGFFPPVSTELEKNNIEFYAGWHPEKFESEIGRPDFIMTGGSGTSPNNPEVIYAKENSIPVYPYPEVISRYFIKPNSIVSVGTWGKTTTSALLSYILIHAGLDPSYFTGGLSLSHKTGAIANGKWSVVEGDEYQVSISDKRPKFVYYSPTHLLITSLSWDHADLYPDEESYYEVFENLIKSIPIQGLTVANKDRENVRDLVKDFSNTIYYGKNDADYMYKDVIQNENGINFTITHKNVDYKIYSPMVGAFQAENITGCFAMAHQIGIDTKTIISSINNFKGLKRRLEKRYHNSVTVIDDIAHSPEKARSILENLRNIYKGKIIAVFEPNIGGRQKEASLKYDNTFDHADLVIIPRLSKLKISEEKNLPMEGNELGKVISRTHPNVKYIENDILLVNFIIENTKKNDVIAFLGSHGFRGMIDEVITSLRQQSL
jgi:UDP-N-acetylmuramate: L-alanyl-gamma-D-glutamyl-meso-diaminopimelate ligase